MVDNLMDVIINFVGLVKLVPKVGLGKVRLAYQQKGDLKLRKLRQKIPTQELVLACPRDRDLTEICHASSNRNMPNMILIAQLNENFTDCNENLAWVNENPSFNPTLFGAK